MAYAWGISAKMFSLGMIGFIITVLVIGPVLYHYNQAGTVAWILTICSAIFLIADIFMLPMENFLRDVRKKKL
jgi:hypothetical protein